MSGFRLLGTLRNKLLCTLGRLRQQLRLGLRACEIRLRRTVRTDFLLRVPATLVIGDTDGVANERCLSSYGALSRALGAGCAWLWSCRAGQGDFLFVARMRAASVVAIIEAIRRLW